MTELDDKLLDAVRRGFNDDDALKPPPDNAGDGEAAAVKAARGAVLFEARELRLEARRQIAAALTDAGVNEAPPEKSEGQLVLERLLAVQRHMVQVTGQLVEVKCAVGVMKPTDPPATTVSETNRSQFLPALRLLADRMEQTLGMIESHVNDLAGAF